MVDLLLAYVEAGSALPARFFARLTAEERARADRFRLPRDRTQFIAARGLLHDALHRLAGVADARIATTPGGKPTLAGIGLPPGLDFNLSHTDGLVACALGVGVDVGIDAERLTRTVDAAALATAQFAAEEQAAGRDTTSFLRLWTLKEAVTKAVGLGLAIPLRDFACTADPPRLLRTCTALGPAERWRLESWAEAGHVVALAVRGTAPATRLHWVDLAASDPGGG